MKRIWLSNFVKLRGIFSGMRCTRVSGVLCCNKVSVFKKWGVQMLIKDALEDTELMSDSEKELASFFLQERLDVVALTARQLAASLFVSPSTVTRFCQRLGFSGFPDFKDAFIKEKQYLDQSVKDVDVNKPFKRGDSMWSVANAVRQMYAEVSEDTLGLQD